MKIEIEAVTPATLHQLEAGLRALAQDLGDPFCLAPSTLERALFADPPACMGAVAQAGALSRGVALFSPLVSTSLGCPGVYVSDLWVAPDARGAGLGRAMLGWVAAQAGARWGSGFMRLAAYDHRPRSVAFYHRLGFVRTDGETSLRLSGAAFEILARTI